MAKEITTLLRSLSTGHDACPPVMAVETPQALVDVNFSLVCVTGALWNVHGCPIHWPHPPIAGQGSTLVDIEWRPVMRRLDPLICPAEHKIFDSDELIEILS